MKTGNITIERAAVKTIGEINLGYRKYKSFQCQTNLPSKTTSEALRTLNCYEVESLLRQAADKSPKATHISFQIKDVENEAFIKELATVAKENPEVYLQGVISEPYYSENDDFSEDQPTLEILVENGEVKVTIL